MTEQHEHNYTLLLGPDGHGMIYGDYEGYIRRCKCGDYAPDLVAWGERRLAEQLAEARRLVAQADAER
jgi:hypothetical protein